MKRFVLLLWFSVVAQLGVALLFPPTLPASISWYVLCALNPLNQPSVWVLWHWPGLYDLASRTAAVVGPILWAAIVELLLRTFFDRPKNSASE